MEGWRSLEGSVGRAAPQHSAPAPLLTSPKVAPQLPTSCTLDYTIPSKLVRVFSFYPHFITVIFCVCTYTHPKTHTHVLKHTPSILGTQSTTWGPVMTLMTTPNKQNPSWLTQHTDDTAYWWPGPVKIHLCFDALLLRFPKRERSPGKF